MQMNKHNDESLKENNHLRALARAYLVYCLRDIDGVPRRLEKKMSRGREIVPRQLENTSMTGNLVIL